MRTTFGTLVLCLAALSARAGTDGEATTLLAQADGFRSGFDSFVTRVRITSREGERTVEAAEFEASIKGEQSYVRFLSPRTKGQALIMRGDDMWLLLPSVARPVRITPIQRLLGNAANGDIARLRYSDDYEPTVAGETTDDGAPCAILELKAKRKGATYQRILYTVRRRDGRPVRAELFLTSGKPLKTVTYGEPKEMAGRLVLARLEIHDATHAGSFSIVETLDLAPRALPDKLFNPARAEGQP
jgi:outer membrane lipoprotein-sorting protein